MDTNKHGKRPRKSRKNIIIVKKPKIIAIIPAYNEENTIAKIILLTKKYVDKVIVCDDGSTDMTAEIAEALGAIVLRHEKNKGKGAALKTLLKKALELDPDVVICLDADGQHNPEDIPKLVRPILDGKADIVIGSRCIEESSWLEIPLYRKIGLKVINSLLNKGLGRKIKDTQSGFRAFSRKALPIMLKCKAEGYGVETEQLVLAVKHELRVIEVPIEVKYKGLPVTSKKNPLLHGFELIDTILKIVLIDRPLLFLAFPGTILFAIGIALECLLILYNMNPLKYSNTIVAFIGMTIVFIGLLLIVASLILHAMKILRIKWSSID